MSANENDPAYPFQEGAFFGNVFSDEAYVCRGGDAGKGEQQKRLWPRRAGSGHRLALGGRCRKATVSEANHARRRAAR